MKYAKGIMLTKTLFFGLAVFLSFPQAVFAQTASPEVTQLTSNSLTALTLIATLVSAFFLVKGGYLYITSTGKPDALEDAKKRSETPSLA